MAVYLPLTNGIYVYTYMGSDDLEYSVSTGASATYVPRDGDGYLHITMQGCDSVHSTSHLVRDPPYPLVSLVPPFAILCRPP